MSETGIPPLYDEEKALRELARGRLKRDKLTRGQVILADGLAENMLRHFSPEETETAGRALLIGAASSAPLAQEGVQSAAVVNILGFAAARLIADGRAWLDAQGGDGGG